MSLVDNIANAIAVMEGFFTIGSVSRRNGNPGNLRSWGDRPIRDGYAAFIKAGGVVDDEAGWKALRQQVAKNIARGLTLYEFFGGKPGVYSGFAPSEDGNQPKKYAEFVGKKIGIDPSEVLNGR